MSHPEVDKLNRAPTEEEDNLEKGNGTMPLASLTASNLRSSTSR